MAELYPRCRLCPSQMLRICTSHQSEQKQQTQNLNDRANGFFGVYCLHFHQLNCLQLTLKSLPHTSIALMALQVNAGVCSMSLTRVYVYVDCLVQLDEHPAADSRRVFD